MVNTFLKLNFKKQWISRFIHITQENIHGKYAGHIGKSQSSTFNSALFLWRGCCWGRSSVPFFKDLPNYVRSKLHRHSQSPALPDQMCRPTLGHTTTNETIVQDPLRIGTTIGPFEPSWLLCVLILFGAPRPTLFLSCHKKDDRWTAIKSGERKKTPVDIQPLGRTRRWRRGSNCCGKLIALERLSLDCPATLAVDSHCRVGHFVDNEIIQITVRLLVDYDRCGGVYSMWFLGYFIWWQRPWLLTGTVSLTDIASGLAQKII